MIPEDRPDREVTLRPRRQLTLPAEICRALGIQIGDRLHLSVGDGALVARPRTVLALQALREIQRALSEASIAEEELQAEGRRVREKLSRSRHGQD